MRRRMLHQYMNKYDSSQFNLCPMSGEAGRGETFPEYTGRSVGSDLRHLKTDARNLK
jgi:hypothetical protein